MNINGHAIIKKTKISIYRSKIGGSMISKLLAVIRDIALFCALLMLIQVAFNDTKSYILEHKQSMIHELDRNFIDQLYTAQRQLHILEEHPIYSDTFSATILDLKSRLSTIEEQYKKNSPGLALLGPIGTTAIVTKEEQLLKKLLIVVNDIGNILHQISNSTEIFQQAATIQNALNTNKKLMPLLITS